MSDAIRIKCKKCETIFAACKLPLDVYELVAQVQASKCPVCGTSGRKSYLYTEPVDERQK